MVKQRKSFKQSSQIMSASFIFTALLLLCSNRVHAFSSTHGISKSFTSHNAASSSNLFKQSHIPTTESVSKKSITTMNSSCFSQRKKESTLLHMFRRKSVTNDSSTTRKWVRLLIEWLLFYFRCNLYT